MPPRAVQKGTHNCSHTEATSPMQTPPAHTGYTHQSLRWAHSYPHTHTGSDGKQAGDTPHGHNVLGPPDHTLVTVRHRKSSPADSELSHTRETQLL